MRFRRRPIEVEARQFTAATRQEIAAWCNGVAEHRRRLSDFSTVWVLFFDVQKGYTHAEIEEGDWVIKEPDGDGFYPCTAAEFERGYERIM